MKKKNTKNVSRSHKPWDKRAWLEKSKHKDTSTAIFASPICDIIIGSCDAGLHSVAWQTKDRTCDQTLNSSPLQTRKSWGSVTYRSGAKCPHIESAASWLRQYFEDPHVRHEPPSLCFRQVRAESCIPVWKKLQEATGPGKTVSYSGLAKLCGNPKASRFMGYAMGHNHFGLIVPCHRVVTSSGALGNYCRGRKNHIKAWLFDHERTEQRKQ